MTLQEKRDLLVSKLHTKREKAYFNASNTNSLKKMNIYIGVADRITEQMKKALNGSEKWVNESL